jgi:lipoprotein-releasing system permease protein
MGANKVLIKRIFIAEGMMISIFGGIFGLLLGGLLAWMQQEFGFIKLGNPEGSYIIDAYPVKVQILDFFIVLFTVLAIGSVTVWFPVRQISRKFLKGRISSNLVR